MSRPLGYLPPILSGDELAQKFRKNYEMCFCRPDGLGLVNIAYLMKYRHDSVLQLERETYVGVKDISLRLWVKEYGSHVDQKFNFQPYTGNCYGVVVMVQSRISTGKCYEIFVLMPTESRSYYIQSHMLLVHGRAELARTRCIGWSENPFDFQIPFSED